MCRAVYSTVWLWQANFSLIVHSSLVFSPKLPVDGDNIDVSHLLNSKFKQAAREVNSALMKMYLYSYVVYSFKLGAMLCFSGALYWCNQLGIDLTWVLHPLSQIPHPVKSLFVSINIPSPQSRSLPARTTFMSAGGPPLPPDMVWLFYIVCQWMSIHHARLNEGRCGCLDTDQLTSMNATIFFP